MPALSRLFAPLTRPTIVFYALIWLMVLLVLGTIAQRYVGLYVAQQTFFYSWILWIGYVPTPGGLATLGLITLSLAAKLILASHWTRDQAGIIITHFGVLLLAVGGLITLTQAREGHITLFEGEKSSTITAYHDRELVVEDAQTMNPIARIPWHNLHSGTILTIPTTSARLEIKTLCRNCTFTERKNVSDDYRGRARNFDIAPAPLELEDEVNRAALLFRLTGADPDKDGVHLTADFIDQSPWFTQGDRTYNIALRKVRTALPFTIELVKFETTRHPGTDTARTYVSDVIIHDQGASWAAQISMNNPLRYRGYTFYQSSFLQDGDRQGSVLATVQNAGRIFPYLASFVIALGLLIHIFVRRQAAMRRAALVIAALIGLSPTTTLANTTINLDTFAQIPILDHGRVKPMDTFARSYLEIFSGKDRIDDLTAPAWLAELLFTPATAHDRPIFRVHNSAVRDALKIEGRRGNRFSFNELVPRLQSARDIWGPLLEQDRNRLTLPQKQLLELIENIDTYIELSRALSFAHSDIDLASTDLVKTLGLPQTHVSYLDLRIVRDDLERHLKTLIKTAQTKNANQKMKADEIALINTIAAMKEIDEHQALTLLRVVPPQDGSDEWHTPWKIIQAKNQTEWQHLETWQAMTNAYRASDAEKFNQAASQARARSAAHTQTQSLTAEHVFNQYKPFHLSLLFYIGALVFMTLSLRNIGPSRHLYTAATLLMVAALVAHTTGLLFRMYITMRPPVTNLYDSIIFVGLVVTVAALFFERRRRNGLFLMLGALGGTVLQSTGLKFDAEGDTMRVLVAVLDTNFWLSTHVTMITIGYGFSILTALLAHVALIQMARNQPGPENTDILYLAIISLFFTTTGTILGGIWADQSWGRFWGWDPKENGALLIVLWLIWCLHGRLSGHLRGPWLMAAFSFLAVIVACAWFGVNLLGVGLHSYGFTQTAVTGFVVFCLFESLLISAFAIRAYLKRNLHA